MRVKFLAIIFALFFLIFPFCSAAHYINGSIENAKDGTPANGHTVVLWNPLFGIQDNLTDIVGPTGNSLKTNSYMIDCSLSPIVCVLGDTLSLKVINNGDEYVSEEVNVDVSASLYDLAENRTLNSPPEVQLINPKNYGNYSSPVLFNCSSSDLDNNLKNISLYGNWTGQWILNETKSLNSAGGYTSFTKNLPEGYYKYACKVTDNLSSSTFSTNYSFTVDSTPPIIDSILKNISYSCGNTNTIRINCTTYDELLDVDKVIIQTTTPLRSVNYSATILTGNTYYYDILLNETGKWEFKCVSNDSAGNINSLSTEVNVYSASPELYINFSKINLSKQNPIEKEIVKINALIENLGCGTSENLLIGFFEGDPASGGVNIGNTTISIGSLSSTQTSLDWSTKIGKNFLYVFADSNFSISEEDETNNKGNITVSISSWQEIYGNTTVNKIIGNLDSNIKKWFNESFVKGNVFITDSEASVNWLALQAIGRTKSGSQSSNDFSEIDNLLGMDVLDDSVSNVFSENQDPRETTSMMIQQRQIEQIPVINSTENSNFITGILWDSSDDSQGVNGEFDSSDKEDIVFVANVNKNAQGDYGIYDYEINIPAKLREYNTLDIEEVYLYYELN